MSDYEAKPWSRDARRHQRRLQAIDRQAERDSRTDAEQLARLESAGHGHCKEAVTLRNRIENS